MIAVGFGLVTLARRTDRLTVRCDNAKARFLLVVLVDFELQLFGVLYDPLDAIFAIGLLLVALTRRGQRLAVDRLDPPTILFGVVLIDLEFELVGPGGLDRQRRGDNCHKGDETVSWRHRCHSEIGTGYRNCRAPTWNLQLFGKQIE